MIRLVSTTYIHIKHPLPEFRPNNLNIIHLIFQNITYQENLFLQRNDVTLQNIDSVYQIVDRKKRLMNSNSKISSKLEGLQIVCKVGSPLLVQIESKLQEKFYMVFYTEFPGAEIWIQTIGAWEG